MDENSSTNESASEYVTTESSELPREVTRLLQFHPCHGSNIRLESDSMVASRCYSYADGIIFSMRPLAAGEIFLVEIEKMENSWSEGMRMGLTLNSPGEIAASIDGIPHFSIPDLNSWGNSWIYTMSKFEQTSNDYNAPPINRNIFDDAIYMRTSRGAQLKMLFPDTEKSKNSYIPIVEEGSRVGMLFVPTKNDCNKAELHFIINGVDTGPATKQVPLNAGPLYVVLDIYGKVKQIRIIQLYALLTLQNACRHVIVENFKPNSIAQMPIPRCIKSFLLQGD